MGKEFGQTISKPKRHLHRLRRDATLFYPILQVQQGKAIPPVMAEEQPAYLTMYKVAIPLATNVTSAKHRPKPRGRFELKQNMVRLLHNSG